MFNILDIKNLKFNLILGLLKCVAFLPLCFLYIISDILSFIAHKIIRYRIKIVRQNLKNSFPEKEKKELRKIERLFYQHLCDVLVETIKLLRISDRTLEKHITLENIQLLKSIADESVPIIIFLGHYGNWEWIPFFVKSFDNKISKATLYQPLHSDLMNKVIKFIRERHGLELIPSNKAFRYIIEKRSQGETFAIGFIGDQRPLNPNIKEYVTFLNQRTAVLIGGETLGEKAGAKFIYLDVEVKKRGYYLLNFKEMVIDKGNRKISNQKYPYTALYFKYLEQTIRRKPPYWLWSHNRWNLKK